MKQMSLAIFALLVLSASAWGSVMKLPMMLANTCVSAGTGNWRAITWNTCGSTYPGTGDTAQIATGNTVTIPSGEIDVVGTSPAVNQGASWALDCVSTTSTTAVLQVYGTLQFKGPVRQCNANWLIGQAGVGGGELLHDNSGSQTALPPASITSGSVAATGIATLNGVFNTATNPVAQQSVCVTGTGTALDTLCGGIISNSGTVISAQFNYYTAISVLGGSGTATFWPHYEWQICAQTANCVNALLKGNGIAANHSIVTNANTTYPQGNFGGFTAGGTGRTNEYTASSGRGVNLPTMISGGGNVDFAYVDADHLGLPGLGGGSQWLTTALGLTTGKLLLDHVICRPCTALAVAYVSVYTSSASQMKITDSSLGAEPVDGIAALFWGNNSWTSYPAGWFYNDSGLFGSVGKFYINFPMSHVAQISMPVTANAVLGTRPGQTEVSGSAPVYATPPVTRDWLTVNNSQGVNSGSGMVIERSNYSRWVHVNLNATVGADCVGFQQGAAAMTTNFLIDGLTLETWAPTADACGLVKGAFGLTQEIDSASSDVTTTFATVLAIPKVGANAGQPPYQWVVIERSNNSGGTTHIQTVMHNVLFPGTGPGNTNTVGTGMAAIGHSAELGTGGGFQAYNNLCFTVGLDKTCRMTVWNSVDTPANNSYTADHNGTDPNAVNGGATTLYYDGTHLNANMFSNGKPTFVQTNPGTGDVLASPRFLDQTRNQLTWAQQVNGITYSGYAASGANRGPQVLWQVYQCTVTDAQRAAQGLAPLCLDYEGNSRTWNSNWDWSNNTGGDPTPACAPRCYYDWVTRGFQIGNPLFKGAGRSSADFGLTNGTANPLVMVQ